MRLQNNTIVLSTYNRGKAKEFADLFGKMGIRIQTLNDFEHVPQIVEDGETFMENAEKKAKTMAHALGVPVLADDSGLCVDLLDGRPGVRSARFAGESATDEENNLKLLEELKKKAPHPSGPLLSEAKFVCVLVLYDPFKGEKVTAEGECKGFILDHPRGNGGFGYDPLFYIPHLGKTMAELSLEEKNRISHRFQALRKLVKSLEPSFLSFSGKKSGTLSAKYPPESERRKPGERS